MKQWKRRLGGLLFARRLFSPWFAAVYGAAWYRLARLCRFGGIRRNLPILGLCVLFFAAYLIFYWIELFLYGKRSSRQVMTELWMSENQVRLPDGTEFDYQEVRWYKKKKEQFYLFLKGYRFVWLDTEDFSEENKEYLTIKLTQRGILATHFWKLPMAILIGAITGVGAFQVVQSAQPYNGKLSWAINRLKHERRVTLVHNNIYEDGLDGIFEDIRRKVPLPEKLYLENSFNLHFAADGTVLTLDTFLRGYDSEAGFGGTYLISYNSAGSDKIEIYVNEFQKEPSFDDVEDLEPLLQGMRVIPLQDTVKDWNQDTYGILYYGLRNWGYNATGICYISPDGTITKPPEPILKEIEGCSISVFCPEDESITPVRYIYQGTL